jgi:hypothetical protein
VKLIFDVLWDVTPRGLVKSVWTLEAPGDSTISVDDPDYATPGYSRQNLKKCGSSTAFQKER